MSMGVDRAKLQRYAYGLAQELHKAHRRRQPTRAYWINTFIAQLKTELAILDEEERRVTNAD